ncbi:kinase-like domain-containing protein [Cyathus striatus]|nr:kinase-like domain-containing protein [Cyathus striatus]
MELDISFALVDNPEWMDFWYDNATKAWFLEKGYHLFTPMPSNLHHFLNEDKNVDINSTDYDYEQEPVHLQEFPYPFPGHSQQLDWKMFWDRLYPLRPVAFAQDSHGRLVALKFIEGGSEEHKCLQFVHSLKLDQTKDACILPVLDFLPCGDHWFAIMPFWSQLLPPCNCEDVRDVLDLMHDMLKALSFLHKHKIFHRDIKISNFVFNFLPIHMVECYWRDPIYKSLQSERQLVYSVIDFGISIKFPDDYSAEQCRLPYKESWWGTHFIPDTMQGEFDFDPFAYDVGVLGIVFAESFQYLTPLAPMLAPLIDKMVTRNIQNRFTASQALQFLEDMRAELTEEQLSASSNDTRIYIEDYEDYDRWAGLPADFVEKWVDYREPPLPLSTRFLRVVCASHPWLQTSMAWTRKSFHLIGLRIAALRPRFMAS